MTHILAKSYQFLFSCFLIFAWTDIQTDSAKTLPAFPQHSWHVHKRTGDKHYLCTNMQIATSNHQIMQDKPPVIFLNLVIDIATSTVEIAE